MMNLSVKFKFLPENLEKCKSVDMFKKSEEGRLFQQLHYRSNICSLQMDKVDGYNCAWCSLPPKNKEETIRCKGFIPPKHVVWRAGSSNGNLSERGAFSFQSKEVWI